MPQQDLPLDLVVLADLGLPAGHAAVGRVHRLEPDGFTAFMTGAKASVTLGAGAEALTLSFPDLRSFRPEGLATQIPDVRALLELRQKVTQRGIETRELEAAIAGLPDGSPLKAALRSVVAPPAAAAPPAPAPPPVTPSPAAPRPTSGGDALDAIFGMVRISQLRSEALDMLKEGITAQYEAEHGEPMETPQGRVARRKASYAAAIGEASHWHDRIGEEEYVSA